MSFCQTGRPVACAQCAFDPCYARATVVRARFLAAAFSDGSYLAHVNDAYLRHVTFCIVRGLPLFIVSPISQPGPASVGGPLPTNSARLVQSPRRRRWRGWTNVQSNTTCVPYFSIIYIIKEKLETLTSMESYLPTSDRHAASWIFSDGPSKQLGVVKLRYNALKLFFIMSLFYANVPVSASDSHSRKFLSLTQAQL